MERRENGAARYELKAWEGALADEPADSVFTNVGNDTVRDYSDKSYNKTYHYKVRACAGTNCSGFSGVKTVVVSVPGPPADFRITSEPTLAGAYELSWDAALSSTDSDYSRVYQIQEIEKAGDGTWPAFIEDTEGESGFASSVLEVTSPYSVTGKDEDKEYRYRLRSCYRETGADPVCASSWTPSLDVYIPALGAPENLSASSDSSNDGKFTLSWNPLDGANAYQIEVELENSRSSLVSKVSGDFCTDSSCSYDVAAPALGSYTYYVRGCVNDVSCARPGAWALTAHSVTLAVVTGFRVCADPGDDSTCVYSSASPPASLVSPSGLYTLEWGIVDGTAFDRRSLSPRAMSSKRA